MVAGGGPSLGGMVEAAPRILVVDDDPTVSEVVARYLERDGYVVETLADGRTALRRARGPLAAAGGADSPRVHVDGDLEVDIAARQARRDGDVVSLTAREFELLAFLVRHPRQAFRREEILEGVWGYRYGDTSTVTVHVRRLREKIEPDPANPVRIATVWGVGYRWEGMAQGAQGVTRP